MALASDKILETYRFLHQSSLRSSVLSIRGLMFIVGKISLFAAVGFCYLIGETYRQSAKDTLPTVDVSTGVSGDDHAEVAPLNTFSSIAGSPIFGKIKTDAPAKPATPASALKLRLVAVNASSSGSRMAIIEDTAKQDQDVFDLNENVFGQGTLVAILADSIRVEHGGRIDTISLVDAAPAGGGGGAPETPSDDETDFSVAEDELSAALANLPQLLSQARAVPYFRNGQSIGMRLFAIRSGSMYEKLGLKNGDIVLAVNDNSLSDPAQALKLFEQLKSERSIDVKLERNSSTMSMHYTIR